MSVEISSTNNQPKLPKDTETINQLENLINNLDNIPPEELKSQLQIFAKNHKKLLQEVKLLTSVGDRLQKKIKSANEMLQEQAEEIRKINKDLQDKNIELQFTIDELTKAKAGKRATTIILIFSIALFIVTEVLESTFEAFFKGANMLIIYGFKVFLAVGFKPIEGLLEKAIIAKEMKRQRMELEQQQKSINPKEIINKNLNVPKIEVKNKTNSENLTNETNNANPSYEMTSEDIAKLERKLKRETMKKMGENRE